MIFLTSLLLLLNSALVNASIGGWTLSNPTAVGASILYDGTKGSATSSILISPNASQVAKVLRGGLVGYALTFAVEQLLGAVDWVLDPTNNQVKYKEYFGTIGSYYRSETVFNVVNCNGNDMPYFSSSGAAVSYVSGCMRAIGWGEPVCNFVTSKLYICKSPIGHPVEIRFYGTQTEVEKNLSLITAAQQVIENAESDNLDAQFAVLAAATNILSEAEQDDAKAKPVADELDNNAKCPSGIVRNGSCWVCDKSLFMPYTRATRDAKNATRGKSCKNVTDTTLKAANSTLFRNLINARVQENACWSPPDPNHAIALVDAQNALSLCEN
ncbi:hypothetical protein KTH44_09590 [Acinetobacter bereziniae]|uniref:hypothetical protein n=1 Tax=Acinetobacter bereziniae TaxID=106648 RepID=UPI0021CDB36A|nr:hypothetical protein [Acinetobacter bereziniae]MCU4319380.1 hypothetical protein [Acinetobacter bereziniae]